MTLELRVVGGQKMSQGLKRWLVGEDQGLVPRHTQRLTASSRQIQCHLLMSADTKHVVNIHTCGRNNHIKYSVFKK